jgi:hypothetical protein
VFLPAIVLINPLFAVALLNTITLDKNRLHILVTLMLPKQSFCKDGKIQTILHDQLGLNTKDG